MKFQSLILCLTVWLIPLSMRAQHPAYAKMSPLVRELAMQQRIRQLRAADTADASRRGRSMVRAVRNPRLCAFLRLDGPSEALLRQYGCTPLARFGNIFIADIPVSCLTEMSLDPHVLRIEARQHPHVLLDSTALHVNAVPVYSGQDLPQAYTGKDVVVGVMDIGFDLTHPTFYDTVTSDYRIRCLWDQLSADTIGSSFYVGNDYQGRQELLAYAHSRDGLDQSHGTHTAGIAAGAGYTSPYTGMAYESDICLVANATSENAVLIDSADYYKYTYATDALGFKYIFDYADRVGKPCVINFSEGSTQDFRGDDLLLYEVLDSLTGPGHILVASAGNTGWQKCYIHKPVGKDRAGAFVSNSRPKIFHTLKSTQSFLLRFRIYGGQTPAVVDIPTADVLSSVDSLLMDTIAVDGRKYVVQIGAYPSCYNKVELVYDVMMQSEEDAFGTQYPVSMEMVGADADIQCYRVSGDFNVNSLDPSLDAGDNTHGIYSPSSAPCVISVGASAYRGWIVNYKGEQKIFDQGRNGQIASFSAVGPTFDNRIKPDVTAPGVNVISSYSSFRLATHPDSYEDGWDVEHFDFKGRTYSWNCNSGTSMAAPVVTGAIALWLEADPKLSPDDCKEIFSKTCTHTDPSLSYPNNLYGHGQIDVYAGLLEVLKRKTTGLEEITFGRPKGICVHAASGVFEIRVVDPTHPDVSVNVYAVDGSMIRKQHLSAGQQSSRLDLSGFRHGVYILHFKSEDVSLCGSLIVRVG